MNKFLIFPLSFMFLLTIFTFVYSGQTYLGSSPDVDPAGNITITGSAPGTVDIPGANSQTFDIWQASGFLVILTIGITVSLIAGIHFLGSGLSEFSNKQVFISIIFIGMWGCLTAVSQQFLFNVTILTTLIWIILTFIFVVGVSIHMTDSSGG